MDGALFGLDWTFPGWKDASLVWHDVVLLEYHPEFPADDVTLLGHDLEILGHNLAILRHELTPFGHNVAPLWGEVELSEHGMALLGNDVSHLGHWHMHPSWCSKRPHLSHESC